jgi:hypothetical protein
LSLQTGWKKRKDHLGRYLSTMYGIDPGNSNRAY